MPRAIKWPGMTDTPTDKIISIDTPRKPNRTRLLPAQDMPAWLNDCVLGDTGKPLSVLASALAGIRAALPISLAFDEMSGLQMLVHSLEPMGIADFSPRPLTDVDVGV